MTMPPETPAPLIDIFAKLNLTLDSVKQEVIRARVAEQTRLASQPNTISLVNVFNVPGSGNGVVDLGSPQDGRIWHVRSLLVVRSNFTTGTVTTSLYIGTNSQTPITSWGMLPIITLRRQYSSLPVQDKFSPGELSLMAKEHLMIEYLGGASGSSIFTSVVINDEPLKRARPVIES